MIGLMMGRHEITGIIGRYLETLTPEQEDRVLERRMRAINIGEGGDPSCGCLIMTVHNTDHFVDAFMAELNRENPFARAAFAYERACYKFGVDRVNAAIRMRVLRNRGRRAAPVVEAVAAA